MAEVRFLGKHYPVVTSLMVCDGSNGKGKLIMVTPVNGQKIEVEFNKNTPIRIELEGATSGLNSSNCATVFGHVKNAKVGNYLYIEGYLRDYKCDDNRVRTDKSVKVLKPEEESSIFYGRLGRTASKSKIVHIKGNLQDLNLSISNIEASVFVKGLVEWATVGNCLKVKGEVYNCSVENGISCTYGKSLGNGYSKQVKLQRQQAEYMNKTFDELFGSIKK